MKKRCKLAQVSSADYGWRVSLNPGLPYDPRTKGMPHRLALVVESKVQGKSLVAKKMFLFCEPDDHEQPNVQYVYRIVRAHTISEALETLGYSVRDVDSETEMDLARGVLSKLSGDELKFAERKFRLILKNRKCLDEEELDD